MGTGSGGAGRGRWAVSDQAADHDSGWWKAVRKIHLDEAAERLDCRGISLVSCQCGVLDDLWALRRYFKVFYQEGEAKGRREEQAMPDDYVAWLRYQHHDGDVTTIHVCDSDAPGAFRVYRWARSAAGEHHE